MDDGPNRSLHHAHKRHGQMTRATRWVVATIASIALVAIACRSESNAPQTTQSSVSLPAVSLPDLSRMEPSVQQQMTEQSSMLTRLVADSGTRPADLANAYGDLGNLLMAADYNDAAEPYYLHAQALAPNDAKWPY